MHSFIQQVLIEHSFCGKISVKSHICWFPWGAPMLHHSPSSLCAGALKGWQYKVQGHRLKEGCNAIGREFTLRWGKGLKAEARMGVALAFSISAWENTFLRSQATPLYLISYTTGLIGEVSSPLPTSAWIEVSSFPSSLSLSLSLESLAETQRNRL